MAHGLILNLLNIVGSYLKINKIKKETWSYPRKYKNYIKLMSKSLCLMKKKRKREKIIWVNKIIGIHQLNLPIFLTLFFIFLLLPGDSKCCEKKWRHFFLIFLGQRCNLNLHQIRAEKEKRPRCPTDTERWQRILLSRQAFSRHCLSESRLQIQLPCTWCVYPRLCPSVVQPSSSSMGRMGLIGFQHCSPCCWI